MAGVCLWRHFLKFHNYTVVSERNAGLQLSSLSLTNSGNLVPNFVPESGVQPAASCRPEEAAFTPKIAPLEALQWPNGPIYTKSAQSLTGSSLQCSEAWICTNISSSSYPSNLCTLIRLIKGNQSQNISRGRQIISFISIVGPQTNLFLSDNSS